MESLRSPSEAHRLISTAWWSARQEVIKASCWACQIDVCSFLVTWTRGCLHACADRMSGEPRCGGARGGRCASAGGAGRSDALGEPLEAKSRAAPAVPRIVNLSHVINTLASWQNEEFTSCGQRFKWEQQFEAFQIPRPKINDARINSWMRVTQWQ